jgi:hypothetical protein
MAGEGGVCLPIPLPHDGSARDIKHERQNGRTLAGQEIVRDHHRLIDGRVGTSDGIVRKAKGRPTQVSSDHVAAVARNRLPILVRRLQERLHQTGRSLKKTLRHSVMI